MFELLEKKISKGIDKSRLEDFPIVKCVEGEKILLVQRQHPIILFNKLFLQVLLFAAIGISSISIIYTFLNIFPSVFSNKILSFYIGLTILSAFFLGVIYTFMSWYFHFYIITNKAILVRYGFHITGPFSDAVFGEHMHIQQIIRNPQNMLYDFLKIEDVYVYFYKLEREEPFIFKTPSNPQAIEELLQDLIMDSKKAGGG